MTPETSEATVAAPASTTIQAKAKDTASADYDLTATAAATPTTGDIPHAVCTISDGSQTRSCVQTIVVN